MKRVLHLSFVFFLVLLTFFPFISPNNVEAQGTQVVYVVPVEQSIERGLESFLNRAFTEAENAAADMIILEIDTLGGEIDAALGIGELIMKEEIPVVAYIKGEAISAGSYIALNADKIYMEPGSHIGAAAPRTASGEETDPKVTSWWASHMMDAAGRNNRDATIARGMVDPNTEIPGLKEKGELITLDSNRAVQYGMADGIVESREELLQELAMDEAYIEEVKLAPAEKLARFVTNPYVMSILLIIGIAGLLIEIFIPGFGISGIIGISAFGLYFFGHYIAGFAGWEAIILFVLGLILIIVEIFVPSFGIFGFLGLIGFAMGISLAAYETSYGMKSLLIALLINTVLLVILIKYFGHRGVWNRFILRDEQRKESGYVSHSKDKNLVGKTGKTLTKLRPSGVAVIEGKRFDVVSEGNFIGQDEEIEVIFIEGTRIVVKRIANK